MQPREVQEIISLIFDVVQRTGEIDGHLIVIASCGGNQPELVGRIFIKNKRSKSTQPSALVIAHLRNRSFKPEIGSIPCQTSVVSQAITVVAEAELIVSLV